MNRQNVNSLNYVFLEIQQILNFIENFVNTVIFYRYWLMNLKMTSELTLRCKINHEISRLNVNN